MIQATGKEATQAASSSTNSSRGKKRRGLIRLTERQAKVGLAMVNYMGGQARAMAEEAEVEVKKLKKRMDEIGVSLKEEADVAKANGTPTEEFKPSQPLMDELAEIYKKMQSASERHVVSTQVFLDGRDLYHQFQAALGQIKVAK